MTVDELQNFIADNVHANVDDKIVGQIMNDAANMDFNSFVNKWDDFLMEHSEGWSNTRPSDKDIYTRIREAYGSSDSKNPFNIPENYSDEIYESKFKDVPKAEYDKALQAMSKHWETEKKAREYESGRYNRAKEVKEGGPKWWLASEYSKNRYINEPEKSLFNGDNGLRLGMTKWGNTPKLGDVVEGPLLNKGDDIRDVMLGGAGLAGDFLPGGKALVGPIIRGYRDYENYNTPYGKSLDDIGKERTLDLGTFLGAAWLANFRKGKRIASGAGKDIPVLGDVMKNAEFTEGIKDTNKSLGILTMTNDLTTAKNAIEAMPDNSIKGRLLKEFGDFHQYGNAEAEGAFMERLRTIANAEIKDLNMYTITKEGSNFRPVNTEELGVNVQGLYTSPQRAVGEKAAIKNADIKQAARFTPEVGPVGAFVRDKALPLERTLEQGAAKRLSTQYEADVKDKDRKLKDWYIKNYARDWELGFKPNEKEGDPLWEAYKEYKGIK